MRGTIKNREKILWECFPGVHGFGYVGGARKTDFTQGGADPMQGRELEREHAVSWPGRAMGSQNIDRAF